MHWLSGVKCGQKSPIYPQMLTRCQIREGVQIEVVIFSFHSPHLPKLELLMEIFAVYRKVTFSFYLWINNLSAVSRKTSFLLQISVFTFAAPSIQLKQEIVNDFQGWIQDFYEFYNAIMP